MRRRDFLRTALLAASVCAFPASAQAKRPNLVFVMCDDLGYGDVGFNGNTVIQTPHLDRLARNGGRFTRFYAGAPVCSPTRGACLTGRSPIRYGINGANVGRLPEPEITLAEVCREKGYRTGHFGKWHLGTLTTTVKDANRGGPEHPELFSPPQAHGFDVCFSAESKVPTWDPAVTPAEGENFWGEPGAPWNTAFWNERGERVTDNLDGDAARVVMDRAEPFIRQAAAADDPFLAVIWFHTPHAPVVASERHRALYAGRSEDEQHYYGCITAMDEQVGRLDALIGELGLADDTILWFCSDNGPERNTESYDSSRNRGVTGGLRGRKRSLFDGGVVVPAFVSWPGVVAPGSTIYAPCSVLDYFPTVAQLLGYAMPDDRALDGVDLRPILAGAERAKPIPFRFAGFKKSLSDSPTLALVGHRYKLLTNLSEDGAEDLCFDIPNDPGEQRNIIAQVPDVARDMRAQLAAFIDSARASHGGADYSAPYAQVTPFLEPTGAWTPE